MEVARRLPNLEKLDGEPIIRSEDGIQVQVNKPELSSQNSKSSEPIVP